MSTIKSPYLVLQRIDHDKPYLPDQTIMLTPDEAESLRGLQVIEAVEQAHSDLETLQPEQQLIDGLQGQLAEAEQTLARERAELAAMRDTLAAREQDLQSSQTARAELTGELTEARLQVEQLGQQAEALKAQIADLQRSQEPASTTKSTRKAA